MHSEKLDLLNSLEKNKFKKIYQRTIKKYYLRKNKTK